MSTPKIKTRFAPSPTGDLHLGGARTALFAWLFAKHYGGDFILRIEDTDAERSSQASVNVILEAMAWLGLTSDEDPLYQSQRLSRYQAQVQVLMEAKQVYRCYCSKERLETLRESQRASGEKPRYDGRCRHLNHEEKDKSYVLRFKQPTEGEVSFHDLVRGDIRVRNSELDDMIVMRSDGSPTYNFTVVVDDADMGITHVLRGDDHINNTPRQIHLFQALGYPIPAFAHLSSILGADGKKLSKRNGAKSVLAYRDEGYLPEALLNMLARLGWSHGDQEIFSVSELIQYFDLKALQKSAACFDPDKLGWLNQQYLAACTPESLVPLLREQLDLCGVDEQAILQGPALHVVIALQQARVKTMRDMAEQSAWLYKPLPPYEVDKLGKVLNQDSVCYLKPLLASLMEDFLWESSTIQGIIKTEVSKAGVGFGLIGKPLRAVVTAGIPSGGNLADLLALLGRETVVTRMQAAIDWLAAQ